MFPKSSCIYNKINRNNGGKYRKQCDVFLKTSCLRKTLTNIKQQPSCHPPNTTAFIQKCIQIYFQYQNAKKGHFHTQYNYMQKTSLLWQNRHQLYQLIIHILFTADANRKYLPITQFNCVIRYLNDMTVIH